MSRWLIKWYPIEPAEQLTVTNLDVLDCKNYCSKRYQEDVQVELDEYSIGAARSHTKDGEYVYYNNRTMRIIETDDILDAVNKFFREMEYERKGIIDEEV